MKNHHVSSFSTKSESDALRRALTRGFTVCKGQPHAHFILGRIIKAGVGWEAEIALAFAELAHLPNFLDAHENNEDIPDIQPEFTQAEFAEHLTAFYLQRQYEDVYYEIAEEFPFSYVHIMDSNSSWNTIFLHSPDIDLYEATHPSALPKEEKKETVIRGKSGSGSRNPLRPFIHHTLEEELEKQIRNNFHTSEYDEEVAEAAHEREEFLREMEMERIMLLRDEPKPEK